MFIYVHPEYYIYTIDGMQNEMDFYSHYNDFEYNHDFLKDLWKIDNVKDLHLMWDDNVYSYKID